MDLQGLNQALPAVVEMLVESILAEPRMHHLNRVLLPDRDTIVECIRRLRQLVFPGYFGKQSLTSQNIPFRVGELIIELSDLLFEQVRCCLRYRDQLPGTDENGSRNPQTLPK